MRVWSPLAIKVAQLRPQEQSPMKVQIGYASKASHYHN